MSRSSEAFIRLSTAMLEFDAACRRDDRFIQDEPPVTELKRICRSCPLFTLCRDYADIERPKSGVWAAKTYREYNKTKPTKGNIMPVNIDPEEIINEVENMSDHELTVEEIMHQVRPPRPEPIVRSQRYVNQPKGRRA